MVSVYMYGTYEWVNDGLALTLTRQHLNLPGEYSMYSIHMKNNKNPSFYLEQKEMHGIHQSCWLRMEWNVLRMKPDRNCANGKSWIKNEHCISLRRESNPSFYDSLKPKNQKQLISLIE